MVSQLGLDCLIDKLRVPFDGPIGYVEEEEDQSPNPYSCTRRGPDCCRKMQERNCDVFPYVTEHQNGKNEGLVFMLEGIHFPPS